MLISSYCNGEKLLKSVNRNHRHCNLKVAQFFFRTWCVSSGRGNKDNERQTRLTVNVDESAADTYTRTADGFSSTISLLLSLLLSNHYHLL